MDKLYTVAETAEYLSSSEFMVREKIRNGDFDKVYKLGNRYRIPEKSLVEYLAKNIKTQNRFVSTVSSRTKKKSAAVQRLTMDIFESPV